MNLGAMFDTARALRSHKQQPTGTRYGCWPKPDRRASSQRREIADLDVLSALRSDGGVMTAQALVVQLARLSPAISKSLTRLVDDGAVERVSYGQYRAAPFSEFAR